MSGGNGQFDRVMEAITKQGLSTTAEGLSTMLGRPIQVQVPRVSRVPIRDVANRVGGPEQLIVAVYLMTTGDLPGHIMLILPHESALRLVDMLLEQPEGTTQQLTPLGESALGEVGNISASMLLNFIAATLGLSARPSPPAVIVDMAGAILDVILTSVCQSDDELLLLEAVFQGPDRKMEVYFWLVPDNGAGLDAFGGDEDGEQAIV
ncbi:MAG: CheY-P-specific phosphatase CheC [Chloroflexi bacterium]|nr:CheY-P-specific phosphatase CheC [Chloroflexota bacterium]